MAIPETLTSIDLNCLPKTGEGKARNLYEVDSKTLLFVATDRISAYDVIMKNVIDLFLHPISFFFFAFFTEYFLGGEGIQIRSDLTARTIQGIPAKGIILTLLSAHWFEILSKLIPGLQTHFLTLNLPKSIPPSLQPSLQNRSMQVRRLKVFPIEAIVRGYITGSAWKEYKNSGTVHGMSVSPGLRESEAFPEGPIYTPSTKGQLGEPDLNISREKASEIIGSRYAQKIEEAALQIYMVAQSYAAERDIIIADTKLEFALDEDTDDIVLVDEVITPDSSRFWPAEDYEIGRSQKSFDKQYLRDWLTNEGLQGIDGASMPDRIIIETFKKYKEAYEKLTGQIFEFERA
ncbi:Phosphoribosylaminoimidazole-succinocarboxamide synthase [Golovinomyces cichoracearum]|uniref:Phosphoribosylaminoimidazole-succinocarboxamide synthase n=1 Tax=Golovinomyces cichoracearum TaxID=62708 RepID=A0A420HCM2_9PEZI|nr:Phosphoribosylaminoimidazole-succinocarboxamide synthase [Golovinomyces cichoracearum]